MNATEWQKWWEKIFKYYAEEIESGQIRLIDTIDGDAPIATNRNQHPMYAMFPPTSIAGTHREQHRPEGGLSKSQENKEKKKRKLADRVAESGRSHDVQLPFVQPPDMPIIQPRKMRASVTRRLR